VDLIGGPRTDREAAPDKLREAMSRYKSVHTAADALGQAFAEQDETRTLLRTLAEFLPVDPGAHTEADRHWSLVVAEVREVQKLLVPPQKPRLPDVALISQHANDLRVRRTELLALFARLRATGSGDPGDWLAWPGWTAADRKALADRSAELLLQRTTEAISSVPATLGAVPTDPVEETGRFDRNALRQARRAVDLLSLTGDPESKKLAEGLNTFEASRSAETREALAEQVRTTWAERLVHRYTAATTSDEQREAIGWAIHPFDLEALPRTGDTFPRDAAAPVRKNQTAGYYRWMAEKRYQPDARALSELTDPAARTLGGELNAIAFDALAAAR
jgi:hypothetical protein